MIEFLAKNYIWFLVTAVILIFALIGYLIEQKNSEGTKKKVLEEQQDLENIENIAAVGMTLGAALKHEEEQQLEEPVSETIGEPIVINKVEKNPDSDIVEEPKENLMVDEI